MSKKFMSYHDKPKFRRALHHLVDRRQDSRHIKLVEGILKYRGVDLYRLRACAIHKNAQGSNVFQRLVY